MEKLIIIGAGPAGISAALYAARANMDPLVLNYETGSLDKAEKIENYYGLPQVPTGKELYEQGIAQAKALGIRILQAQVLGISGFDTFEVKTTEGTFEAVSVILATGAKRKTLPIKGIKEWEGRGVSYCAVCDAFFYRGKKVAVIGNGDFAIHEGEELQNMAEEVTILTNGMETTFTKEVPFRIDSREIAEIKGEDRVGQILFQNGETLEMDGIFIAMGTAGSTEIARQMGAQVSERGNIEVDDTMQTTIPGLFAAGDCTGGLLQVAKAVYEGCLAGINAGKYVKAELKKENIE